MALLLRGVSTGMYIHGKNFYSSILYRQYIAPAEQLMKRLAPQRLATQHVLCIFFTGVSPRK